MNICTIIGLSGANGELKTTQSGFSILNLSIATSKKVKEEWKSTWHRIVVLGKTAEVIAPLIKKGCKVFVSGEMQTREWQDSQGNKKQVSEILANHCYVIAQPAKQQDNQSTDEDIPF